MPQYDKSTALLVVDVQNDFAHPKGSLYVKGGELVVPGINREIEAAAEAGACIFYTQDWHPESTPHFQKDGGIWPVHCVRGSWGAELVEGLEIAGPVVQKGTGGEDGYSGFTMREPESGDTKPTGLDALLKAQGVKRVVIAGIATDYCVKETAIDARHLGYETTVLRALVRAVELHRGDASRAFQAMRRAGAVLV